MMRSVLLMLTAAFSTVIAAQVSVTSLLSGRSAEGFERAFAPREFSFPADHGAHPGFRHEWWYLTGQFEAVDGRRFGFQLTFFRFALAPDTTSRSSAWASRQAWMAHFALSDVAAGRFHAAERTGRGALGIAGARIQPFRVWLGDWSIESDAAGPEPFPLQLRAGDTDIALRLELSPVKPRVLQGERGWDAKGPEPGNASFYYAYPRLAAAGMLQLGGTSIAVRGSAWLDREWGSGALARGLVGWDWLALQLDDGRELMLYRLRQPDGHAGPYSKGALIDAQGHRTALAAADFEFSPRRWWTSPSTGVRYPVAWSLRVPAEGLALDVDPLLDAQELDLGVRYWEGAVSASGSAGGQPTSGRGYLELAGY